MEPGGYIVVCREEYSEALVISGALSDQLASYSKIKINPIDMSFSQFRPQAVLFYLYHVYTACV